MLAFTNAFRGEVYLGIWRFDQPRRVTTLFPPRAVGEPDLVALPAVTRMVGDGPEAICTALARRYGVTPPPAWPRATVLLDLIGVPGREGSGVCTLIEEPALWEPTYGRPAEAQVQWERRHGRPLPDPDSQRS
ncbi:MAG: hypothetical protein K6U89_20035 [Chloroflexi bacterium]|nr:hypothetical protein [Chloroflexota bacterium]